MQHFIMNGQKNDILWYLERSRVQIKEIISWSNRPTYLSNFLWGQRSNLLNSTSTFQEAAPRVRGDYHSPLRRVISPLIGLSWSHQDVSDLRDRSSALCPARQNQLLLETENTRRQNACAAFTDPHKARESYTPYRLTALYICSLYF